MPIDTEKSRQLTAIVSIEQAEKIDLMRDYLAGHEEGMSRAAVLRRLALLGAEVVNRVGTDAIRGLDTEAEAVRVIDRLILAEHLAAGRLTDDGGPSYGDLAADAHRAAERAEAVRAQMFALGYEEGPPVNGWRTWQRIAPAGDDDPRCVCGVHRSEHGHGACEQFERAPQ